MSDKVGADDFIASGASEEDLEGLARAPVEAAQVIGPGEPETVDRVGDDIVLAWERHGVRLAFGALHEKGDGLHGEIVVTSTVAGEVHWGRLNLSSTVAREQLVKKLTAAQPPAPWRSLLDRSCRAVALAVRQGEPVVPLVPAAADPTTRHLIAKLVVQGETNLIVADGGSGKSLLALALAASLDLGIALPGGLIGSRRTPVLYLDWESTCEEHQDRLAGLLMALDAQAHPRIYYRPMTRSLTDEAALLRAEVGRRGIGLVIVDSLAPASGPEPEGTDAGVRTMNALRTLAPATRLVLAHVSKANAEQRGGSAQPFGSVFNKNLARNMWELRRAEDDGGDDLVVGLYHRKANSGRLLPPFGLRFEFRPGSIALRDHELGTRPDLMARASLPYRIRDALRGGAMTVEQVAAAVEAPVKSVGAKLRTLGRGGVVRRLDDLGKKGQWGLPA